MTVNEIKEAILALDSEAKKTLIIETFPVISREAMNDPGFLMRLLPLFLGALKESGLDLQQMIQLAGLFSPPVKK